MDERTMIEESNRLQERLAQKEPKFMKEERTIDERTMIEEINRLQERLAMIEESNRLQERLAQNEPGTDGYKAVLDELRVSRHKAKSVEKLIEDMENA